MNHLNESIHLYSSKASGNGSNNTFEWPALEQFVFDIETVYLWIILIVGVPGNCATIFTVTKMSPAKSLTVYIALLAVVDNLAIISKLLVFVLLDHKVIIGKAGCKLLGYLGNFLSTFANWILVALSIERFAAVWFPVRVAQIWTFRKSTITVCIIAVLLSALFLHLFWTMTFVIDESDGMVYCSAEPEYIYFLENIWYWINVVIYATIPCVLLVVFNVLIIIGIVRANRKTRFLKEGKSTQTVGTSSESQRQITVMLVTAAITLVVLTTPRSVVLILTRHYDPPEKTLAGSVYYLVDTLAFVLCDFNHAVNFYVYSLSAKTFRRQFFQLISCKKDHKGQRSSQYISLTYRNSSRKVHIDRIN